MHANSCVITRDGLGVKKDKYVRVIHSRLLVVKMGAANATQSRTTWDHSKDRLVSLLKECTKAPVPLADLFRLRLIILLTFDLLTFAII